MKFGYRFQLEPVSLGAAAIAGGAALLGTGGNMWMQGKTNKKTREWNESMYKMQRGHNQMDWLVQNKYNEGLWNKQNEYNERVWHMMNEYNSPMAQMQRFKEAGLNPNLIYGQGNTSGSISTGDFKSDNISPSRVGAWNPKAPTLDVASGIASFNATRESAARTNNLEEQNKLIGAQALDVMASTKKKGVETANMERLIDYQIDALAETTRKTNIEADIALNRDEREAAANSMSLSEAAQRIANLRKQNLSIELENRLKKMDIQLKAMGINPSDPAAMRILGRIFNDVFYGDGLQKFYRRLKDELPQIDLQKFGRYKGND